VSCCSISLDIISFLAPQGHEVTNLLMIHPPKKFE
jgi:hypothetical protein